jgi:hypothetical protein
VINERKEISMEKLTEKQLKNMKEEAIRWMTEMQVDSDVIARFQQENRIHKIFVNHDERKMRDDELTNDELKKIRELEEKKGFLVYYVIQDNGLWPEDGEEFPRYTYLCVPCYENIWQMCRESIADTGMIPAYVENMDEPEYSEYAEISFRCVHGMILNAS